MVRLLAPDGGQRPLLRPDGSINHFTTDEVAAYVANINRKAGNMSQDADEMFRTPEAKAIPRDRWGRPRIIPPGGGDAVPYVRASTLAKTLDDTFNLISWKARMTAYGLARSEDLIAWFASQPDPDEWELETKREADRMVESATDRAGATRKRTKGTAIHSFTETYDRGQPLEGVPSTLKTLLRNYIAATKDIRWLAFERFCVQDDIQAAGTFDRAGQERDGLPRIYDLKSGNRDYLGMSEAVQLAVYARSKLYSAEGKRNTFPSMDLQVGTIIHLDQATDEVTLYDVDLEFGWHAAQRAVEVRNMRKQRGVVVKRPEVKVPGKSITQRLTACTTLDELRALYAETGAAWGKAEKETADMMAAEIKNKTS